MSQATATAGPAPAARVTEAPVRTRRRLSRSLLRPLLMLGGIAVVIVGAGAYWLTGGRYVSIDDAYVRAAKETLSTDVPGIVADVPVHEGQHVAKGELLGLSGATGRVTGPHLHWAVRWQGAYLDPAKLLRMDLTATH